MLELAVARWLRLIRFVTQLLMARGSSLISASAGVSTSRLISRARSILIYVTLKRTREAAQRITTDTIRDILFGDRVVAMFDRIAQYYC